MPNSDPQIGDVYNYPYIWKRQTDEDGDAVAEKYRPCCVAIRLPFYVGDTDVFLLSISTKDHFPEGDRIEVSVEEAARAGLDFRETSYLTICEYNETDHTSPVFSRAQYRGTFSPEFMKEVVKPRIIPMMQMAMAKAEAGK